MNKASALYRLLGDEARLRLLRILSIERLNVTELTGILALAQSGVSRHLGLLKDAGLVAEDKEAGFTYYKVPDTIVAGEAPLWSMLKEQFSRAAEDPVTKADDARLQEVLRLRKENFARHAIDARDGRQLVPGRSWAAWARAIGLLLPPLRIADLGCGEGYLTIEASRWASKVIAIDRSDAVLARAREFGRRRRATNVLWRRGELEALPIKDASVDVALLSQALHHACDPAVAIREAARILVAGGRIVILDLRSHHEEWVRAKLGDRTLGFTDKELRSLLLGAGFDEPRISVGSRKAGNPFAVIVAVATKPAHTSAAQPRSRRNG